MRNKNNALCVVCAFVGVIAPWSLLLISGIIGFAASNPYWEKTAAYLAFSGLALLAFSYLFMYMAQMGRSPDND